MRGNKERVLLFANGNNSTKAVENIAKNFKDKVSELVIYSDSSADSECLQSVSTLITNELENTEVSVTDDLSDLEWYVLAKDINKVYISLGLERAKDLDRIVSRLSNTTASIYFLPDLSSINLVNPSKCELTNLPVITIRTTPFQGANALLKRILDIIFSSIFLLCISPLLLAVAIGIKLTSPGPVIFKQKRHGFNGKEFYVYKFRTMSVCETGESAVQAKKNDPRVTKIGAFLRKTSIDEIPQFFNVLEGTMSVVGPRPHPMNLNNQFKFMVKGLWGRHLGLPGITGLAQVNNCRGETATAEDMEKRVKLDIEYLSNWNLFMDIKIMFMTAFQLIYSVLKIKKVDYIY